MTFSPEIDITLQIYRTDDVHTAIFGKNYSKFYSAFRQGTTPMTPKPTTTAVPSKRPAVASEPAPKRRRINDRTSLPQVDQHHPSATPARRSAVVTMKIPKGSMFKELASPSNAVGESSTTPMPRSRSETKGKSPSMVIVIEHPISICRKPGILFLTDQDLLLTPNPKTEQSSQPKGVGLYRGKWEYAPNEEIVPDYQSVAEKIANLDGRTTRRALAKMTSGGEAVVSGRGVALSSGKEVRKSGRARNTVDYTRASVPENNHHEIATQEQVEEGRMSPIQTTNQASPSTSSSSTSIRSTLLPDNPSRSTSTSTATNTEQHERPNRSWNSIVYEILATSNKPLTFPQIVQTIKGRYPFFNSSSQDKVLKSGPKNPLYFHEAFCRAEIVKGKQAWALKPGTFVDKKTGEVLTPQPRFTIPPSRIAEPVRQAEDRNPGNVTAKSPQSFNPRSSIPRFGREILNSPELPDSQDARAITSSPQTTDSRVPTEHPPHLEQPYQHTPPTVQTPAHEITSAVDGASANVSDEASPSSRTPQPHLQWASINGSPMNTTTYGQPLVAAGAKLQGILKLVDAVDYKPPGTGTPSITASQALQPQRSSVSLSPSIASSTGEKWNGSNSTTTQPASTSVLLADAESPTHIPTSSESRTATSQPPAAATPSVTTLPSMQLYVIFS